MTTRNTLVSFRKDPVDTIRYKWKFKRGAKGAYEPSYNSFFTEKNVDIIVELHENMHGFINQMNPELRKTNSECSDYCQGKEPDNFTPEKWTAYKCFDEGMANWAAFKVAELDEREVSEQPPLPPSAYIPDDMSVNEALQLGVDMLKKTRMKNDKITRKKARLRDKALETTKLISYSVGTPFVTSSMDLLTDRGIELNKAIVALIQNPPETIDDLTNPETFITEKLLPKLTTQDR